MKTHVKKAALLSFWLGIFLTALVVNAQTVIAPTSNAGNSDPRDPQGQPTKSIAKVKSAKSLTQPLLQRGPVAVRPHLLYRILAADGLRHSELGVETSSIIQTIASGVLIEIGSDLTMDYTYTSNYYSSSSFHDDTGHQANFAWMRSYDRWTFRVGQTYGRSSSPMVETAQQTDQKALSSNLGAIYRFSTGTRLELDASRTSRDVDNVQTVQFTHADVTSWSTTAVLRHTLSPRLDVGVGSTFGYDNINPGSDMSYYQPNVQLTWQPTKKIICNVEAGAETRRFTNRNVENLKSILYSASLEYSPFDVTRLVVTANHSVSPSFFADGAAENAGWRAALEQRLLTNLSFSSSFARYETRYVTIGSRFLAARRDRMDTIGLRLSTRFLQRGSAGLVYQHGRNRSNLEGYSINSRQMGCELTYKF